MTSELWLRFDIRGATKAVTSGELCSAAIEQAAWAEHNGFDAILFGEHHGAEDGYLSSPMILAAAVAARTKNIRLQIAAILLPLHHPLRIAEDICVLDNVSGGRLDVTIGVGYVPSEFAMFGVDFKQRAPLVEEGIAALRGAFTGKSFEYRGHQVRVAPKPFQPGGPEMLIAGALKTSALRAARMGDGFFPTVAPPELLECYRAECKRLGKPVGRIVDMTGPASIFVSRDPERDWQRVGLYMMHEMNTYSRWARESQTVTNYQSDDIETIEQLKATGMYRVFTPDECLAYFKQQRANGRSVLFNPLCGGTPPDIAWESLELMASDVLPRLKHTPRWQEAADQPRRA